MKRYIDITRYGSLLPQHVLDGEMKWLEHQDMIYRAQKMYGMTTFMYYPGSSNRMKALSDLFVGRFVSFVHYIRISSVQNGEVLTCDILGDVEDQFMPGDSLILSTGWEKRSEQKDVYFDKCPTIGVDLVEWMVRRQMNILVVDMPYVANISYMPELFEIYNTLASANIVLVANAGNLDHLTSTKATLMAFPLKYTHANLAPVRAVLMYD